MKTLPVLKNNFSQITNVIFDDPNMTGDAIAVYCCMVRNAYWELNTTKLVSRLMKQTHYGRDKVKNILKALTNAGYVSKVTSRTESGRFDDTSYVLNAIPKTENPCAEDPVTDIQSMDDNKKSKNIRESNTVDYDDTREVSPELVKKMVNQSLEQIEEHSTTQDYLQQDLHKTIARIKQNPSSLVMRILKHHKTCRNLQAYVNATVTNQLQADLQRKPKSSPRSQNQFCNFKQNTYDFAEIERKLLAN